MKKSVILSFLLLYAIDVHGMSELEKAFKEKMESLSVDAFINCQKREIAKSQITLQEKMLEECNNYNARGHEIRSRFFEPKNCSDESRKKERVEDEYRELNKKKDSILKEKDEIKIKLIEKFDKLPKWWKESEKKITDEVYK